MRERLVDKFCRCVKKVKKTFRSEGPSIAICTKSVLQKRRRTLRKVRCRKHILVTQPMKGGELIAGGEDTLVFYYDGLDPEDILEQYPVPTPRGKETQEQTNKWMVERIQKFRAVVRMICAQDTELRMHRALKHWCDPKINYLNGFIQKHINLWAGDGVYKINVDETSKLSMVKQSPQKFNEAITRFPNVAPWYGLITRYQTKDVKKLVGLDRVNRLADILRTLLHIDGRFVHFDLHMGNAAIMRDGTTVIHDFGRAKVRDYLQPNTDFALVYPQHSNKRTFRSGLKKLFTEIEEDPDEILSFGQFFFLARYLRYEQNAIDEIGIEAWLDVSSYIPNDESSRIEDRNPRYVQLESNPPINLYDRETQTINYDPATKSETTVEKRDSETLYYMQPMYETRYHQIARVFDILSVLRAFADGKDAAEMAAKKILHMIHGSYNEESGFIPNATRDNVEAVINDFLTEVYDSLEVKYTPKTKEEEIEEGNAYLGKVKTDNPARMRKGGGILDKPVKFDERLEKMLSEPYVETDKERKRTPYMNPEEVAAEDKLYPSTVTENEPVGSGRRSFKKKLPRLM